MERPPGLGRRPLHWALVLVAAAAAAALPGLTARVLPGRDPAAREIRLVARDMAYFADDGPEANPTLRVQRGERVRLVLRNEDAGIAHDLAIPQWNHATRRLTGKESDAIEFTVPARRGRYAYICTPHSAMMRGTIEVE